MLEKGKENSVIISKNELGVELYFADKPAKKIINRLKELKFRWHSAKKCWYAYKSTMDQVVYNQLSNDQIDFIN